MKTPSWHDQAECRDLDPAVFYAAGDLGVYETQLHNRRAKEVCAGCPVRSDCLEAALVRREDGIWGGTTEAERREIRRARGGVERPPTPITHGTTTGYNRGCRDACCREANAAYKREHRVRAS